MTTPRLAAWFSDMIQSFPPMSGPLRSEGLDDARLTDYSIGKNVIYAAFASSKAEPAYAEVRRLAALHRVGFFDVSGDCEIVFPADEGRSHGACDR